MKLELIKKFKSELKFLPLRVKTEDGEVIFGRLASEKYEKKILEDSGLNFMGLDSYFCLINEQTAQASFLSAESVKTIDLVR